jgi:hypothetical protein
MSIAKGVGLQPHQIEKALELRERLDFLWGDIELWAAKLGYDVVQRRLKQNAFAVLVRTLFSVEIRVRPKQRYKELMASVAHEICHDLYHTGAVTYRQPKSIQYSIEEGQAEMFASLVVFPSLKDYETVDEFYRTCGVSSTLAEMRIAFFEKYGW